jgi:hypothetical protein
MLLTVRRFGADTPIYRVYTASGVPGLLVRRTTFCGSDWWCEIL